MKKLPLLILLLVLFVSCSTQKSLVAHVEYIPVKLDLTDTINLLEKNRPDVAPAFPADLIPGADEITTLRYLANVISAYKTSLEAWQNYSDAQTRVILTISEELK